MYVKCIESYHIIILYAICYTLLFYAMLCYSIFASASGRYCRCLEPADPIPRRGKTSFGLLVPKSDPLQRPGNPPQAAWDRLSSFRTPCDLHGPFIGSFGDAPLTFWNLKPCWEQPKKRLKALRRLPTFPCDPPSTPTSCGTFLGPPWDTFLVGEGAGN